LLWGYRRYLQIRLPLIQRASFDDKLLFSAPPPPKKTDNPIRKRNVVWSTAKYYPILTHYRILRTQKLSSLTGEKCLRTNVDALLRRTASLVISVRKSNGSAIPWNVPKHSIIKTAFPREGLANFNPLEGHTIRKDWPKGHTCAYIYRWGDWVGKNSYLYKQTIYFFLRYLLKLPHYALQTDHVMVVKLYYWIILVEDIPLCLSIILKWNKICTSSNTAILYAINLNSFFFVLREDIHWYSSWELSGTIL